MPPVEWSFDASDWVQLVTKDFRYVDHRFLREVVKRAGEGRCVTRKGVNGATFEMKEQK